MTPPRSATRSTCGPSSASARCRPTTSTSRSCTASSTPTTTLVDTVADSLTPAESYDGGRYRFDGTVTLDHSGAFGYTVRVVPRNGLLTSIAELGVVAFP